MKKKKKESKFGKFITKVLIILTIIMFLIVFFMNILPNKYLFPLLGVIGVITLILSVLNSNKNTKSNVRGVSIFISILFIIIYIVGFYFIYKTYGFFSYISKDKDVYKEYYIISLKDNNLSINNISDYKIEVYNDNTSSINEVVNTLKNKYNLKVDYKNSISILKEDLLNEEVSLILLNDASLDFLKSIDSTFSDISSVIDTIKVKVEQTSISSSKDISKETFTMYITGIDTYGSIDTTSRSDVNMLVTVNPITNEILLTSIPRDYYVKLYNTTGYNDKLTHAGIYGVETSIKTIEDLLDISIDYYLKVNFSTLIDVIDLIGGIDVYSDKEFIAHTDKSVTIKEGINHMDGKTALAFSRERYAYREGDVHRVQNQQDVVMAVIEKMTSTQVLTKYTSILDQTKDSFATNIKMSDVTKLIKKQLSNNPKWIIKKYILKGNDSYEYTYSMGEVYAYVMIPNIDYVNNAHTYITGLVEGKTFSEIGIID